MVVRVAIAAAAVALCLLEYGSAADVPPTAIVRIPADNVTGSSGISAGKRQPPLSPTQVINETTVISVSTAPTMQPTRRPGKRQASDPTAAVVPTATTASSFGVSAGKRQATALPTVQASGPTAAVIPTATADSSSGVSMGKRQVSQPTVQVISATTVSSMSTAPTVPPTKLSRKRQASGPTAAIVPTATTASTSGVSAGKRQALSTVQIISEATVSTPTVPPTKLPGKRQASSPTAAVLPATTTSMPSGGTASNRQKKRQTYYDLTTSSSSGSHYRDDHDHDHDPDR